MSDPYYENTGESIIALARELLKWHGVRFSYQFKDKKRISIYAVLTVAELGNDLGDRRDTRLMFACPPMGWSGSSRVGHNHFMSSHSFPREGMRDELAHFFENMSMACFSMLGKWRPEAVASELGGLTLTVPGDVE